MIREGPLKTRDINEVCKLASGFQGCGSSLMAERVGRGWRFPGKPGCTVSAAKPGRDGRGGEGEAGGLPS